MISLVVCSRQLENLERLRLNVFDTIGLEYEIIVIDNKKNTMGICEAYNRGAQKARYNILCFIHEDVVFRTEQWGLKIKDILGDRNVGLIGVAGGIFKSFTFSSAWYNFLENGNRVNIIQHLKGGEKTCLLENPLNEEISEVISIDGVFMCCRKEVWKAYSFDEKTLGGFHFYDLDFSLGIRQLGLRNYVTYEVLLEHYSLGKNDLNWYKEGVRVHRKWKRHLPLSVVKLSPHTVNEVEEANLREIFNFQMRHKLRLDSLISVVNLILKHPFRKLNFLLIKNWIKSL